MPPQLAGPTAPRSRPAHAAGTHPRTDQVEGSGHSSGGRHRRPESLADNRRLRPVSAIPSQNSRSADGRYEVGRFPDSFIERGFAETTRADRRRAEDRFPAARRPARAETRPARAEPLSRAGGGRGKHAAPHDLAITVRPLPAVRDAVVEGLPAAKRAADAIREWALYTGDKPPTGTHRAPGTLPIESWLLIGRQRQQALLATLVAAGLALVMIPIQRHAGVDPVAAADRSAAGTVSAAHQARAKGPDAAVEPGQPDSNAAPGPPTGPRPVPGQAAATPGSPTATTGPADDEPPLLPVPPGTGPAHSLRVTGTQAVALTFDDGPDPVQTPKILELLAKYHIKATFCLIGRNVEKHPEIVRQIVEAGHTLCNHTWNHSLVIGQETPADIRADLERTSAAIRAAVPDAPIPFFRAPGGNFTEALVSAAYGAGMTSLYWQVDPQDWDHHADPDDSTHTDRVIASVQKFVKPGSIILSHDFNQPDTIAAYEKLLPWLTENFEIGLPVPPPVPSAAAAPSQPSASEAPAGSQ